MVLWSDIAVVMTLLKNVPRLSVVCHIVPSSLCKTGQTCVDIDVQIDYSQISTIFVDRDRILIPISNNHMDMASADELMNFSLDS